LSSYGEADDACSNYLLANELAGSALYAARGTYCMREVGVGGLGAGEAALEARGP
jgi:hypothetical protein